MKVLIIENCVINFGGDTGSQHAEAGTTQDVDSETARVLCVSCSRALYLDKKDDPTKGQRTATPEDIAAADRAAKTRAAAEKAAK